MSLSTIALVAGAWFALGEPSITFNRNIAPILHAQCASCHHPGGAGPFALLTYDDAQKRAKMIAKVTADRYMPPWLPTKTEHLVVGERRLSDDQIQLIQRWISAGTPQGEARDATPMPTFDDKAWSLGPPDLVLAMSEPYEAPPSGTDLLRTFVLPLNLAEDQHVRAIEFHADNPRVIHHASFLVDTTGTARRLDEAEKGPGYDGMGDIGFNQAGALGAWSPGSGPFQLPAGIAQLIPRQGDFVLEMHISPTGKPETVRGSVGLYFANEPIERLATAITLGSQRIDIAPGEKDYRLTEQFMVPVAIDVLGIMPHAHFVCQKIRLSATLPDGSTTSLLRIDDWDFNFLQPFQFVRPVRLPASSRLEVEFVFDNSAENLQNPSSPPKRVLLGERARDEMALMFLYVSPVEPQDLPALEQAHRQLQLQRMEDGKAFRAQRAASRPVQSK